MRVGAARSAAAHWVAHYARAEPSFRGAYFSGSTVGLADDAEVAPSSDVDVVVVTDRADSPGRQGKFRYRGALLEVSHLPWREIASPEAVLGSYHLAGGFRTDTVIEDPTGHLRELQVRVASGFADRYWVRLRCADARRRIERRLAAIDAAAPFPEQVTTWLFGTGVTTHVLLVAALRNPTVRLRYVAVREVLAEYDRLGSYPELLELLGAAGLSAGRVRRHLGALAETFDATVRVARTPFFFSGDITPDARPVAIGGSQDLIDRGRHREAVFWIIATFARCHTILAADQPELHRALEPAFRAAVADLGVTSGADLRDRAGEVIRYLPRLWRTAEAVLEANPQVRG